MLVGVGSRPSRCNASVTLSFSNRGGPADRHMLNEVGETLLTIAFIRRSRFDDEAQINASEGRPPRRT